MGDISAAGRKPTKRMAFCFDGTWNRLDSQYSTNVVITAESITPYARDGRNQTVYYDQGVGTGRMDRLRGGVFGLGLIDNLEKAYRFLTFNYESGDEIFVFGFSRGAYTARSFVGLLNNCSIPLRANAAQISELVRLYKSKRKDERQYQERMRECRFSLAPNLCVSREELNWRLQERGTQPEGQHVLRVKYLGVWDTVGALGVPQSFEWLSWANRRFRFHDTLLSGFVESARHAVAIDEVRKDFVPTLWTNLNELNKDWSSKEGLDEPPYQQKWFPGNHGSVDGGGERRGLSDQALDWVLDGARKLGLDLDHSKHSRIFELKPNYIEHLENAADNGFVYQIMKRFASAARKPGPDTVHDLSISAIRRWKASKSQLLDKTEYRPIPMRSLKRELDEIKSNAGLDWETKSDFELYQVKPGDTLQSIAKAHLDSSKAWPDVFSVNRDKIENPDRIYVGQVLRIPRRTSKPN